jgi:membrane protease YdiL (CAAX protease family)
MNTEASLTSRLSSRPLIAPAWHTIVFIAIFVGLSVVGGFFQHAARQHPQSAGHTGSAVPGYISVLAFEWLLVLYVRKGVHQRGVRLRDLVGGRWATPQDVLKDFALGAGLWAIWMGLMNPHILGSGTNAAQGLLPQGLLESLAWLPLALSAGFCEELAFRGYLQKQFQAITWKRVLGGPYPGHNIRGWPSLRRSGRGSKNHALRRPVRTARCVAEESQARDDCARLV